MNDTRRRLSLALAAWAALASATPARAEVTMFTSNEMRAAGIKDRLRGVQASLKEGTPAAKRHSTAVTAAFKGTDDWAPAAEAFYARGADLIGRAAALETQVNEALLRNTPQRAAAVATTLDDIDKTARVLRSDHEFYVGLPRLAAGPQRAASQAAMRLLAQTGDYAVTLAYFLDKTPGRPPFAPLPPGVMAIRHR